MITITPISISEINTIETIGKKCLPIYYSSLDLIFLLFNDDYLLFKISENKTIIGFIIGQKKYLTIENELLEKKIENTLDPKRIHIMSIGVLNNYRKKGYGTSLIQHLHNFCKNKLSLYVLTNNESAIKLYQKNNFKKKFTNDNYYKSLPIKSAHYYETEL
tara:strand:- start:1651 stop:2133 length:483 start_codon:yes stop_codon:yes gene_type:complete